MNITSLIGTVGAALTTMAGVPQFIKSFKSRHTKDLSMVMYVAVVTGTLLWFIYGLMLNQPPIYIANAITFLINLAIVILKLVYG